MCSSLNGVILIKITESFRFITVKVNLTELDVQTTYSQMHQELCFYLNVLSKFLKIGKMVQQLSGRKQFLSSWLGGGEPNPFTASRSHLLMLQFHKTKKSRTSFPDHQENHRFESRQPMNSFKLVNQPFIRCLEFCFFACYDDVRVNF